MDGHLRQVQEHRRHHGLRDAIERTRVEIAWASLVMIDRRPVSDDRRMAVAIALEQSFEGLVQAVRQSWRHQVEQAVDTTLTGTKSGPDSLLSRGECP